MDPVASCAERTLLRSPHPALRMSELLEAVSESLDRTLDARRLRSALACHPDRFLLLDTWKCPWDLTDTTLVAREGVGDSWVVSIAPPTEPPDGSTPVVVSMRESVRWLARGLDPRSTTDIGRWQALAQAERAARESLLRRAA